MGRSVVLSGAARCPQCSLPPRWCVCNAMPPVETRLHVHVLIHRGERHKPSSTGTLITRVVSGTTCHVYQRATRFCAASGLPREPLAPHQTRWILHPAGDPLPAASGTAAPAEVVLLDGTWRQAGDMLRSVEGLGTRVRLADAAAEPSRYWLRDQPQPTHLSTAEALIGVLHAIGEAGAAHQLRLHFELHVYATLLSRGRREMAQRFLGHSPLPAAIPDVLDRLHARRSGPPS